MITAEAIEAFSNFGTPFYYYDVEVLEKTLAAYTAQTTKYGYSAHYAVKANCNPPILHLIRNAGLGADCVSGGEVKMALDQGFDPSGIVFAGVGKSDAEIRFALDAGIFCFNCESLEEISVIEGIASGLGRKARIAVRLNPNIDAHTQNFISTGRNTDKFGFTEKMLPDLFELLGTLKHCEFEGLHFHIGSQITDMECFRLLCRKAGAAVRNFADHGIKVANVNLGGGLGVDYDAPDENPIPDFAGYFATLSETLGIDPKIRIHLEPGRSIVAQCGSLIGRVLYVKDNGERRFAIIDAGMNNLIRPALYGAHHRIINISSFGPCGRYDVVGPVCETSDKFASDAVLSECRRGNFLRICSAGAYGEVMEMKYNLRNFAKAYYSNRLKEYKSNIE